MDFFSPFKATGLASSITSSIMSAVKDVEATIDKAMNVPEGEAGVAAAAGSGSDTKGGVYFDEMGNMLFDNESSTFASNSATANASTQRASASSTPEPSGRSASRRGSTQADNSRDASADNDGWASVGAAWQSVNKAARTVTKTTASAIFSPIIADFVAQDEPDTRTSSQHRSATPPVAPQLHTPTTGRAANSRIVGRAASGTSASNTDSAGLVIPDSVVKLPKVATAKAKGVAGTVNSTPAPAVASESRVAQRPVHDAVAAPSSQELLPGAPTATTASFSAPAHGEGGGWGDDLDLDDAVVEQQQLDDAGPSVSQASLDEAGGSGWADAGVEVGGTDAEHRQSATASLAPDAEIVADRTAGALSSDQVADGSDAGSAQESPPAAQNATLAADRGAEPSGGAVAEGAVTLRHDNEPDDDGADQPSSHASAQLGSGSASTFAAERPVSVDVDGAHAPSLAPPTSPPALSASGAAVAAAVAEQVSAASAAEIGSLLAEISALKENDALSRARISALESLVSSRELQLEKVSGQAAAAMDECAQLRGHLDTSENRNKALASQLDEERKRTKQAQKEASAAVANEERAKQDVAEMEELMKVLEVEKAEAEAKVAEILAEGEGLSKKTATYEATIKKLRENVKATEADRDARRDELNAAESVISTLKKRVEELESLVDESVRDKDTASGAASASQQRLSSLEDESARLRSETKALRASLQSAQKEAEDGKVIVAKALQDLESAERERESIESALQAAQSGEATASRLAATLEDTVRDLRRQLQAVQAAAGQREDELRSALDEMTSKWQRAAAAAEDSGLFALAQAYGVALGGSATNGGGAASGASASASSAAAPGSSPSAAAGASIAEALVQQLAAVQSELQSRRDAWASQRATLQNRLDVAESSAEKAEADVRRAESAAADASAAAGALRTELIALRGAKARSDAECALLTDRLRDAESRLASVSAAHDMSVKHATDLAASVTELRSRAEEASGGRAASSHMVSVLRDQLASATEECSAYKREVDSLRMQLQNLNANNGGYASSSHPHSPGQHGSYQQQHDGGGGSSTGLLSSPGAATGVNSSTAAPGSAARWLQSAFQAPSGGPSTPGGGAGQSSSLVRGSSGLFPQTPASGSGAAGGSSGSLLQQLQTPGFGMGGMQSLTLQAALAEAESERDKLAEQIVIMSSRLSTLVGSEEQLQLARRQLEEAEAKHEVVLEMLGAYSAGLMIVK